MTDFVNRRYAKYYCAGIIALITLAVYLPALWNDFVGWDDDVYVFENLHIRSLNLKFFAWAFSSLYQGFWHPLTWISHAVDYALWGLNPLGHHLTSVILHSINTFIVVLLLIRLMEGRRTAVDSVEGPLSVSDERAVLITAGVTGTLFGLHPLHVESVAWIAERKDLICAFFFLMSIIAYLDYAMPRVRHRVKHRVQGEIQDRATFFLADWRYLVCLLFFIFALAGKTMAVSFPAVLLILDWYPLRRMQSTRSFFVLVVEKVPFIALSLVISALSIIAQKESGALVSLESVPLPVRIMVAFRAPVMYLWKMLLPFDLLPLYPYPHALSFLSAEYFPAIALVCCISGLCVYTARKHPIWLSLWAFYLITLLPVLGLVQVGNFPMADRFTYLPGLGPFLLAGLAAERLWSEAGRKRLCGLPAQGALAGFAVIIVVGLSLLTMGQIARWKNSLVLWSYVIEKEPDHVPTAYNNRGVFFGEMKEPEKALSDFNRAIALEPSHLAYNNRGRIYQELGQLDRAIEDYTVAINLTPAYFAAYNNRGLAYKALGWIDRALEDFATALALRPGYAQAYTNRGIVYGETGQFEKALSDFTAAIEADPSYADAYTGRGLVYGLLGNFPQAIQDYSRAVELKPDDDVVYNNRGIVYHRMGNTELAVRDFQKACDMGSRSGCENADNNRNH